MTTPSNKNTKWIIVGSIVLVLAVLIAVGPILVTKYMRTKWENSPSYKVSNLLMKVSGQLLMAQDKKTLYVKGDNNLYYVLEGLIENLDDKIGESCSVLGKMRMPAENDTVDGNKVRMFIGVNKIMFANSSIDNEPANENNDNVDIKDKVIKKARLRAEINAKLNKPIMFDVAKGKVSSKQIKDNDNNDVTIYVLVNDFGDKYTLYKKGADLSILENKEIVCLGREILPPKNMPLIVDETTFEIYEVYDSKYKKLM
jgi:hypothetical protein